MNDNRNYRYDIDSVSKRAEFDVIVSWVKNDSNVIDLGSGDGTLLKLLKDRKNIKASGIEITKSGVISARKKGIKSIVGPIDVRLPYKDKEFDYAICTVTLQMVMYPEVLLAEMKRISKFQIITFPNFAFLLNRLDLLINGVMPRVMIPGYMWYSTGHVHQLSINDFETFCKNSTVKVVKTSHVGPGKFLKLPSKFLVKFFPNLFATLAIFMTR